MKLAAVYVRVSTLNHGQSVDPQLNDLRKLAEQRGFNIVKTYSDDGQSGAKSSRPALDQMLKDAQQRRFQVLLIFRLDRLGRSTGHLIQLLENFKEWGIELVSFSEGLDFSTTAGKLMYQIISAFAEFERDVIRERIAAGLRNARSKGIKLGPKFANVSNEEICRLLAEGRSMADVAAQVGISAATVCRRAGKSEKLPAPMFEL